MAEANSPRAPLAGREGPLRWEPDPERAKEKDQWLAKDGERCDARIRFLSHLWQGETRETYYAHRNGRLLGVRRSLADAKKLAESDKRDPNDQVFNNDEAPPEYLRQTKAERAYLRKIAPPLTMPEMRTSWYNYKRELERKMRENGEDVTWMSEFDEMGVEALTRAYNDMVIEIRELGVDSFRQVARFPDVDTGRKACLQIKSSIVARKKALAAIKAEARQPGPEAREVTPASSTKAGKASVAKQKEDNTMAKKAKAAKKVAKTAKKVATKKAVERPAGKVGEFTAKINTRPGSATDKLAVFLFNNLGKTAPLAKATKAVYGTEDGAITSRIGDLRNKIGEAKASYHIQVKDGDIGLFTGSGAK
jgi:hypothetical protein